MHTLVDENLGKVSGLSMALALSGPDLPFNELFLKRCIRDSGPMTFLDPCPITFLGDGE